MTATKHVPATVEETLRWYAENAAGCRKIGRDGDVFRQALDADGGKRALAALASAPAGDGHVLMPRTATRAMVDAADACTDAYSAYNAMVEAAHVR